MIILLVALVYQISPCVYTHILLCFDLASTFGRKQTVPSLEFRWINYDFTTVTKQTNENNIPDEPEN